MYEMLGDWVARLKPVEPCARLLDEAFYSATCDYSIAYHLAWPWYRPPAKLPDPFVPYFEMWKRGAAARLLEPGVLHVGALADGAP